MPSGKKPLGMKAYGSIPHLNGSRRGPGDHGVNAGAQRILTQRVRDERDFITVMEKLDGSCCAVARTMDDTILPLTRSGWLATTSPYKQHHMFAAYVREYENVFRGILLLGERAIGEWIAQAHGTRYQLRNGDEPFSIFDIMKMRNRLSVQSLMDRLKYTHFSTPALLHSGGPLSIEEALDKLGVYGHHGAVDPAEGVVYRVERDGVFDFMAKFVHQDKQDGCYLPEVSGGEEMWNWKLTGWREQSKEE